MEIKILGSGCAKCNRLYAAAEEAAQNSGGSIALSKVQDLADIASFGVMRTPALVLDGAVKSTGRLPTVAEIETWIAEGSS